MKHENVLAVLSIVTASLLETFRGLVAAALLLCLFGFGVSGDATAQSSANATASAIEQADESQQHVAPGPGVVIHSRFGGQIFGFDVDQNSTEGILSEAQTLAGGDVLAAVETFDQKTGSLLKVLGKKEARDDFVTLGVVGRSIGLIEYEHEISFLNVKRTFHTVNPLSGNRFNGLWTPPLGRNDLILAVSRSEGGSGVAVLGFENGGGNRSFVFSSDVAANTFGPRIGLTDPDFFLNHSPVMAYDSVNNQAVVAALGGNPFGPPTVGLIDLDSGTVNTFSGVGIGFVNGLAVDPETGTACTTTEIDFSVQFYDLANRTGFSEFLPGAINQIQSGADVAFDPVHKLFLVAQPVSSTAPSGSSIHVYDESGNLIESINGFSFSNTFNVIPAHIALNPSRRLGFVDGPDQGVTSIQAFRY